MKKGYIIVYTGDGKGKTTAAIGLGLRALGQGMPVCLIQFIKGERDAGELKALRQFDKKVEVIVSGRGFTPYSEREKDKKAARSGWEVARKKLVSERFGLLILDELTYLCALKYVDEKEIVQALRNKRPDLHVVATGRRASKGLLDAADLVTQMKNIRHPLQKGFGPRKGIEF